MYLINKKQYQEKIIMKIKKNVTLIEICFAIAIFAFAIVPLFGAINGYFVDAKFATNLRVMADRSKKIMVDLVDKATYRAVHEAEGDPQYTGVIDMSPADASGITWPDKVTITDLTTIKWTNALTGDEETLVKLNPTADDGKRDSAADCYWVDAQGTYYRERGIRYNLTLDVQTIPIVFHYKKHKIDLSPGDDASLRAVTREGYGATSISRDMYKQLILKINYKNITQEKDMEYSFVTFKANLEGSYDND